MISGKYKLSYACTNVKYFHAINNKKYVIASYLGTPVFSCGILLKLTLSGFLNKVTLNWALSSGSSKHGKALLASVASNCVVARYLKQQSTMILITQRVCNLYSFTADPGINVSGLDKNYLVVLKI